MNTVELLLHIAATGVSAALGHPDAQSQVKEMLANDWIQLWRESPPIYRITPLGRAEARRLKTEQRP